jgi:hypothetical protein
MPDDAPPGDDDDARWPSPHSDGSDLSAIAGYRLRQVERQVSQMRADIAASRESSGANSNALRRLEEKIDAMWKGVEKLEGAIPNKAEFLLMRLLVFGMAGSALLSVLSMVLLSSGIRKP